MNENNSDHGLDDDELALAYARIALEARGGSANLTPAGRMYLLDANARALDVLQQIAGRSS